MAGWDDVRRVAIGLPEVEEPAPHEWRVKGKLIAWERPLRKADLAALGDDAPDGPILGIRVPDLGEKEALLAENPAVFFTTPHFDNYPAVLARLPELSLEDLEAVVVEAWLAQAPAKLTRMFLDDRG